jgi:hypothetical protein
VIAFLTYVSKRFSPSKNKSNRTIIQVAFPKLYKLYFNFTIKVTGCKTESSLTNFFAGLLPVFVEIAVFK